MTRKDTTFAAVLDFLVEKRGFDFSGCHPDMLARRMDKRLVATACKDFKEYLVRLQRDADELDHLIDVVTINVSSFFRDTLTFELITERILPAVVRKKIEIREPLRIWSAGCARGEEPYSVAILVHELLEKEGHLVNVHLFATDIDAKALQDAREAVYPTSNIENMKYRLVRRYFTTEGTSFRLVPEIREKVHFSLYDILDKKHGVPPESVFGDFDLVLCRNLLIYFSAEYQERIFDKLHHALACGGYLVLGGAETPPTGSRHHFSRVFDFSSIYRKR